ncbi:uncharacterized protein K02A2.6-like [Paramacrobiotus metropolitanus]|uniref:uncharacterized protein K02A2.6-like n=1 Tax=Paramacrobiotus metropolitanus TaxID=2943436 RepID=UPI0024464E86|nr:uncharacterized protein K02A2.6-like [Paramacrobiotus metropolitanus]
MPPKEESVSGLLRFEPSSMTWRSWQFRYRNYVKLKKVTDSDEQKALLLDSLGVEAMELVHSMCLPKDPDEYTTSQIVDKLEAAYVKKTNATTEWANYFRISQEPGETLLDFSNKLRRKAIHCSFPADVLEKNMSSTFLNGLANDTTRQHLMSKDFTTLEKALELAQQYELTRSTKRGQATVEVARVDGGQRRGGGANRYRGNRRGGMRGRGNPPSQNTAAGSTACSGCGSATHARGDCWAKDLVCRNCNKKGHIAKVCRSPKQPQSRGQEGRRTWAVEHEFDVLSVNAVVGGSIHVPLKLNGTAVSPVLDTGSAVTIITADTWRSIGAPRLSPYSHPLRSFTGHPLSVIGTATLEVVHGRTQKALPVVVVGRGGNVLGRDWIAALDLSHLSLRDLQDTSVCAVSSNPKLKEILERHKAVFRDELGHCKHYKARLYLKPGARPVFCKARMVPFAFRDAVEKDLDRLVQRGILTPVDHADWAAPTVSVQKRAGDIRTCADLSTGLNDSLDAQQYPLPTPDELFAKLNGGQTFSTLDLAEAYAQVELEEDSKQLVVINTHKGLFRYNRLPFGVSSGPSIFQQIMEKILQGCEGVAVYLDDIIITGRTEEEHLRNLEKVLQRLEEHGLTLKQAKCRFMQSSVEYLGFVVDSRGRHISRDRVKALLDMNRPTNVSELRAFLGLVNHYGKFLPDLSAKCNEFHSLLKAGVTWEWSKVCEANFNGLKEEIARATFLVHFDPDMPLVLAADASQYGVGAVLCHRFPDGTERPIAHASKTLSPAEKNYGQIEKEALALVFGCRKFHQYIAGREFTLLTDHKPLLNVFGSRKGIPVITANRLQRWALLLMGYTFSIQYCRTEEFGQADGLSRLPMHSTQLSGLPDLGMDNIVSDVHTESLRNTPVSTEAIAAETAEDRELSELTGYIRNGWPSAIGDRLKPYKRLERELVLVNGCICWGMRTVIPEKLRPAILAHLHDAHMGVSKIKAEARGYCWWPLMDKDIERLAAGCRICSERAKETPKVPLSQWAVPEAPWKRVHMDFAGPYQGTMLFIVVDALSKWPEVIPMKHATTDGVIEAFLNLFSRYGICAELVSDNGTQFTSEQFAQFCAQFGIKHIRTPPGHPQSNGQTERFVQTVKDGIAKLREDGKSFPVALRQFLWRYRSVPHATTGVSPAEQFIGRKMRSTMDLLVPVLLTTTEKNRQRYQRNFDKNTKPKNFQPGQMVLTRDYRLNRLVDWVSGKLLKREGTRIWQVLVNGMTWRRHENQLRPRHWLNAGEHVDLDMPEEQNGNSPRAVEPTQKEPAEEVKAEVPEKGTGLANTTDGSQNTVTEQTAQLNAESKNETTQPPAKESRTIKPKKQVPTVANPAPRRTARANAGVSPKRLIKDPNFG